jgi:hypothetical protein
MENATDDKRKFSMPAKVSKIGNSLYALIPPTIAEYLNISHRTELKWTPDMGKHGEFVGVWNPKQQAKNKK